MIWFHPRVLLGCAAGIAVAASAGAQGTIAIDLPLDRDSLPAGPQIGVTATGVPPESCPCITSIEVARTDRFDVLLAADSRDGTSGTFMLARPLPERTVIHIRARVNDRFGNRSAEQIAHATTRSWLRLVSPTAVNVPVFGKQPKFVWSASHLTTPPGPWIYDINITNTATQRVEVSAVGLTDTSFVPDVPLQGNTSYRWSVHARIQGGDSLDQVTVASAATFVISSADAPLATLLHNNFPNPFPQPWTATTCIWFDLAVNSHVRLTVFDLRGHRVRLLFNADVQAGAYGRSSNDALSGCDSRLSWDGTDDRGRTAPAGAYVLKFESDADRVVDTKTILFTGR